MNLRGLFDYLPNVLERQEKLFVVACARVLRAPCFTNSHLDASQRYEEAKSVLLENFGQPHMIVEAHMTKLREIQIKKSDATALMEFVRQLEDSERALRRMGPSYSNRLDNEDVVVMLMKLTSLRSRP